VDQAWQLEQESWAAAAAGEAAAYYAKIMTDDAFVVLPDRVLDRDEVLDGGVPPWSSYELEEPRLSLLDGETVLVSYRVAADRPGAGGYRGQVTSLYAWSDGGWALTFQQHTPD
jgi:hypothetical protein